MAVKKADDTGAIIDVTTPFSRYENVRLNLRGNFQPQNAAVAVMAAELACRPRRIQLSPAAVEQALSGINFPGRMEKIQEHPTVILDGAHNPQKTRALSESIKQIYGNKPYTLIIGMLATKDVRQAIASLLPQARRIMVTAPKVIGKPAVTAGGMKELILEADPEKTVETEESIPISREIFLETVMFGDINPADAIVGDIFIFGRLNEQDYRRLHLAVCADKDKADKPLLFHANGVDNSVSLWPLAMFYNHQRYQKLFAIKRLRGEL